MGIMTTYDVMVLGAGIVGVSTALHLQAAGRSVAVVDRREPVAETSYGNAGLIQREAVVPYSFPRDPVKLFNYAFNRLPEANLHWRALPSLAPFLFRYWRNGSPTRVAATARGLRPLVERSASEHEALAQRAGVAHLFRRSGFLMLFRDPARLEAQLREEDDAARRYGVVFAAKTPAEIAQMEPALTGSFVGGIHMPQAIGTGDPGEVGQGYLRLFEAGGGAVYRADAFDLSREAGCWVLPSSGVRARAAVLALGPWTAQIARRFGLNLPMGFKRGYHMRYAPKPGPALSRTMLDRALGCAITPEPSGAIRVTTGAEFARLDAPPTPVQLAKIEPFLTRDYPIGARLMAEPWMGARPCLPDLLPAIGPVPGQEGLWINSGHQHLGYTLGPVTGRLLAQMICGESPLTEPLPYRPDRF
jgi:D-amino-acid dehydrogenase